MPQRLDQKLCVYEIIRVIYSIISKEIEMIYIIIQNDNILYQYKLRHINQVYSVSIQIRFYIGQNQYWSGFLQVRTWVNVGLSIVQVKINITIRMQVLNNSRTLCRSSSIQNKCYLSQILCRSGSIQVKFYIGQLQILYVYTFLYQTHVEKKPRRQLIRSLN